MVEASAPQSAGRPLEGVGHYLRDIIFGALDGVITTLAVISGASGANLDPRIGVILGFANLVADGLSMGASNYLGIKSELQQTGQSIAIEMPWRHGLATACAFALFGAIPLLAYLAPPLGGLTTFQIAIALAVVALAVLGKFRARYMAKTTLRSVGEVVAIGIVASSAAYAIGAAVERITR